MCSLPTSKPQLCASACQMHPLSLPGDSEHLQLIHPCPTFLLLLAFKKWPKNIMLKIQSLGKLSGAFPLSALCLSFTPWKGGVCEATFRHSLHAAGLVSKIPLSEQRLQKEISKAKSSLYQCPCLELSYPRYRLLVMHWSLFTALGIDSLKMYPALSVQDPGIFILLTSRIFLVHPPDA